MPFTTGHALLIGVGVYQYASGMNVPMTATDAQAVATTLRDPQLCGYPDAQVTLLTNAEATRDAILSTLDRLAERTREGDTVFLFYSGHGHYGEDGTYYLTTADTRLTDTRKVATGTGVSEQELLTKLQALKASRILLIFNACHSGEVSPTLDMDAETPSTGANVPDEIAKALLATGEGRIIITACRAKQFSFIGAGAQTIFGQMLVDVLHGQGVAPQHGYISAFDLYTALYTSVGATVQQQVPETVRQRYGGKQEPELTVLKGVGPFAVALYRGAATLGEVDASAQPPAGTAARTVPHEESRQALERILNVGQGIGVGGDVHGGTLIGRDNVSVQGGQGTIGQVTGPVSQNFGEQRTINTGGGTYHEGDVTQHGVNVSGGSISGGTIVGTMSGSSLNTGASTPASATPSTTLPEALAQVQGTITQAQQQGSTNLVEDLEGIVRQLEHAINAQNAGDPDRRQAKLHGAQADINDLAQREPRVQSLAQVLGQLR